MWRLSARVLGPGQAGPELRHQRLLVLCWCWCWDREWSSLISGQWAEWDRHQLQNMVLCIWLVQHSTHITSNSRYFLLWASLAAWRTWPGSNGSSALNSVASLQRKKQPPLTVLRLADIFHILLGTLIITPDE